MELQESAARVASSKRVLVLGSSGSGKTTFAIRLGELLRRDAIHLDAHFWKPGWTATPQQEWRAVVESLVARETWVMDGTYESSLDLRVPAADAIIIMEVSRWRCLWRVLKRKATVDDRHRPDAPSGQRIDRAFLRYIWQYPRVTQPFVLNSLQKFGSDKPVIQLHGVKESEQFLKQVKLAAAAFESSRPNLRSFGNAAGE